MPLSRRQFLRQLVVGGEPGSSVLVCLFLRGGADTLSLFPPYGDDDYYRARPALAVPSPSKKVAESVLAVDDFYGMHPGLKPLFEIYKEGRIALVQGVGSDNPTGSHFETQDQVEHGEAYRRTVGGGWLGRCMRQMVDGDAPLAAVAIGESVPESLRGCSASSLRSLSELKLQAEKPDIVCQALGRLYGADTGVLSEPGRDTLRLLARVQKLHDTGPDARVEYPGGKLGAGLKEIARMIKGDLGLKVACIDHDGWDTHFFQGTTSGIFADNAGELARALSAFDRDLGKCAGRVTTIVMTEFGRRTAENGSLGTDHGRGFAMLAMGAGIVGGVHGEWPGLSLADEHKFSLGPAGLAIKIDYRSILSEAVVQALKIDATRVFPGFNPQSVGAFKSAPRTVIG